MALLTHAKAALAVPVTAVAPPIILMRTMMAPRQNWRHRSALSWCLSNCDAAAQRVPQKRGPANRRSAAEVQASKDRAYMKQLIRDYEEGGASSWHFDPDDMSYIFENFSPLASWTPIPGFTLSGWTGRLPSRGTFAELLRWFQNMIFARRQLCLHSSPRVLILRKHLLLKRA